MHPSQKSLMSFFATSHRDEEKTRIVRWFQTLAEKVVEIESVHPAEVTAALRKLLEAKDCAVRATLPPPEEEPPPPPPS